MCKISSIPIVDNYKNQILKYLFNFIFQIPVCLIYYFSLYEFIIQFTRNKSDVNLIFEYLTASINCTYIITINVAYLINGHKIRNVLHSMEKLKYPNYTFINLKVTILFFVCSAIFYVTDSIISYYYFNYTSLFTYVTVTFSYLISWVHTFILINYVNVIRINFQKVNFKINKKIFTKQSHMNEIKFFIAEYQALVNIANELNSVLSLHVFAIIILNFLGIICYSNSFCQIFSKNSPVQYKFTRSISLICWLFVMLSVIALFLNVWVDITNEVSIFYEK